MQGNGKQSTGAKLLPWPQHRQLVAEIYLAERVVRQLAVKLNNRHIGWHPTYTTGPRPRLLAPRYFLEN